MIFVSPITTYEKEQVLRTGFEKKKNKKETKRVRKRQMIFVSFTDFGVAARAQRVQVGLPSAESAGRGNAPRSAADGRSAAARGRHRRLQSTQTILRHVLTMVDQRRRRKVARSCVRRVEKKRVFSFDRKRKRTCWANQRQ